MGINTRLTEKKEEILDEIVTMLLRGEQFNISLLTERLSISRKTLYNYFENRQSILVEVVSHYFRSIEADVEEILTSARTYVAKGDELLAVLYRAIRDLDILSRNPTVDLDSISRYTQRAFRSMEGLLERYIREGQDSGMVIGGIPPRRVAEIFILLVIGNIGFPLSENSGDPHERFAEYSRMIFTGIISPDKRSQFMEHRADIFGAITENSKKNDG